MDIFNQKKYSLRFEWGLQGILQLAPISDVVIVVDVLSFTTSVELATSKEAKVFPYRWNDDSVHEFARSIEAIVAGRSNPDGIGLSPSTLEKLPAKSSVVMPSPNGSTLSLSTGNTLTMAGSFRNCRAVAESALLKGETIAVVAAGERWASDHTLRPCIEDYLGAGAILSYLPGVSSPEAALAVKTFRSARRNLISTVKESVSGVEKQTRGKGADVELACSLNVSDTVPIMKEGAYMRET